MRLETGKKSPLCFISTAPYLRFQCSQGWPRVTRGRALWKNFQRRHPALGHTQPERPCSRHFCSTLADPLVSFLCPVLLEDSYIPFKTPTQHFLCKSFLNPFLSLYFLSTSLNAGHHPQHSLGLHTYPVTKELLLFCLKCSRLLFQEALETLQLEGLGSNPSSAPSQLCDVGGVTEPFPASVFPPMKMGCQTTTLLSCCD